MARLTRLALAGHLHHVALRGHSGATLFRDDADRRTFLECLRQAARQHGLAVHAYALLDSEAHWLATPRPADALGKAVQSLGRRYVGVFNRRHARSGALWDGRFRSSVLEPARWLLPAIVHIETMPVAVQLAPHAADWPWSSAPAHLGHCRDPLLTDHTEYWRIGNTPFERERAHADMLVQGLAAEQSQALDAALRRGLALGSAPFIEQLAQDAGRPVQSRPRGRPRRN